MKADALPRGGAAIIDLIGRRMGMALMSSMDGRAMYVPIRLRPDHHLVAAIGMVAAKKLVDKYGGTMIRIPQCSAVQRAARNEEIRRLAAEGLKPVEISRRFCMTDKQIRNILRAHSE